MSNYDLITVLKSLRVPSQFGTERGMADFFAQYPDGVFATYSGAAPAGWEGYRVYFGGRSERLSSMFEMLLGDAFLVEGLIRSRVGGRLVLSFRCRARVPSRAAMFNYEQYEKKLIDRYLNFVMPNGGTITLTRTGSPTTVELEYSIDNCQTWTVWNEVGNVRSLTLTAGKRMYVRNTSETETGFSISLSNYYNFNFDAQTEAYGSVLSLLRKTHASFSLSSYVFAFLFYNCIHLQKAPLLPSTDLGTACYHGMFQGCTSLVTAPELPNTTGYSNSYYFMFRGCTSLVNPPKLLVHSPKVRNYYGMFYGCTSLNKIYTEMTDISANDCLVYWLYNVSPTGDFYCPSSLTIPTGASGIPSGWTRHDL